jgi:hypothetical protein
MTHPNQVLIYLGTLTATKLCDPSTYWSVDVPSLEEVEGGTLVGNGHGYCLVSSSGDIKGLFKLPKSEAKGVADALLFGAILSGGNRLDNFDIYLTKVYLRNGFKIAGRMPFNPEYAPTGWDPALHGHPDVVAMVHDPFNEFNVEERVFTNYDEMISYRDSYL